ncbi:DNA repair protein RAD51 homolog 1-like [Chironomus tepperi]|uniref:DNA repair protein RAD51 homolog 1-like n=1 Tax=Chironomus tepperi TaxID=113505 RepID=UPI00391F0771
MSLGPDPVSSIYDSRLRGNTLKLLDRKNLINRPNIVLRSSFYTLTKWNIPERSHSELKTIFGKTLFTKFETADSYFSHEEKFEKIKFNAESLDELLQGGIDLGCITEFYGQSGSGKTQLCLQLALNCQLPRQLGGLEGKAIYISTDKAFPIKRLAQMEKAMKTEPKINFLDNIFIFEFNTGKNFEHFVENDLKMILSVNQGCIKLIVIDSIAGIYRTETNYIERAKEMGKIFRELQKAADKHNIAIVATNHVTADPNKLNNSEIPAIGNFWSTLLTTRIRVNKTEQIKQIKVNDQEESLKIRTMKVDFSPRLPPKTANFIVSSNGVQDFRDDMLSNK